MKTVIIYQTKKGFTKKVANYIADTIENATIIEVNNGPIDKSYDHYIVLSPIYYGLINKNIKLLIQDNEQTFQNKKLTIVLSGMNTKEFNNTIKSNFSENIVNQAEFIHCGGAYDFKKLNFLEKLIVKKIAGVRESIEDFKKDDMNQLFQTI